MTIRPAYPDELERAKRLLDGYPVPPNAEFLVGVKEQPVERLVADIPWWRISLPNTERQALRFHLQGKGTLGEESLREILNQLEALATENQLTSLLTDFSLPDHHPLYLHLTSMGFEITQTDRYFSMPGESVVNRCKRVYQKIQHKIPCHWEIKSIRGQDPEELFQLVSTHRVMPAHQFQKYWDTSNPEHFEEDYSCVIVEEEKIIATFLHTRRPDDELHIHVDAIHPDYTHLSSYATTAMRNWIVCNCPPNFPRVFTSRADSKNHTEGGNTPLRYKGGTEDPPRHFLSKSLIPNP